MTCDVVTVARRTGWHETAMATRAVLIFVDELPPGQSSHIESCRQ